MRKIALQECIVILTDELLEKLDLIASSSEPIPGNHLLDTGNAVMFWASISNLNINNPTVERGLYFTAKTILMFSEQALGGNAPNYASPEIEYMLSGLNNAALTLNHKGWLKESRTLLRSIAQTQTPSRYDSLVIVNGFLSNREARPDTRNLNYDSMVEMMDLHFDSPFYKAFLASASKQIPNVGELMRIV